jgi:hypothetical protein
MLSDREWAELHNESKSVIRDDPGLVIVKQAQESVAPLLAEAEKIRKDFDRVKKPALELIAKVEKCEPLSSSAGMAFIQGISEMKGS